MTASALTPCIQALRGLAEREAASSTLFHCIDWLALQVKSSDKQHCQLEEEVVRLRSEAKQLRGRTRKLESQLCRCTKERDQLASNLQKTQDVHKDKVQQLTRLLEEGHSFFPQQQSGRRKDSACSQGTQCQIWSESKLSRLQEQTQMLLRTVEHLQERCDQQTAASCAKDAEIEELILVLQSQQVEQLNPEEEGQKENDNSTLDDNSEKGEEYSLPEWLESVQFEPSESMEHNEQQEQEEFEQRGQGGVPLQIPGQGWMRSLFLSSYRFCSFILG